MEWLGEPSWKLVAALVFLVLISGVLWKSRPGKATLTGFLGAVFLLLGLVCCGWMIVTEPEKIRSRLNDMALAANQRDWPRMTKGFSEQFQTYGGMNRKAVSDKLRGLENSYGVRRVVLRQIVVGNPDKAGARQAHFTMRLEGGAGDMEIIEVEALMRKLGADWFVDQVKVYRPLAAGFEPLPT